MFPDDHPDVATSLNNVGSVYGSLGQYPQELGFCQQALAMRRRLFPDADDPDLATSLDSVGAAHQELGQYELALKFKHQAFAIRKRLFPDDHLEVAASLSSVGSTYGMLGKHQQELDGCQQLALEVQ